MSPYACKIKPATLCLSEKISPVTQAKYQIMHVQGEGQKQGDWFDVSIDLQPEVIEAGILSFLHGVDASYVRRVLRAVVTNACAEGVRELCVAAQHSVCFGPKNKGTSKMPRAGTVQIIAAIDMHNFLKSLNQPLEEGHAALLQKCRELFGEVFTDVCHAFSSVDHGSTTELCKNAAKKHIASLVITTLQLLNGMVEDKKIGLYSKYIAAGKFASGASIYYQQTQRIFSSGPSKDLNGRFFCSFVKFFLDSDAGLPVDKEVLISINKQSIFGRCLKGESSDNAESEDASCSNKSKHKTKLRNLSDPTIALRNIVVRDLKKKATAFANQDLEQSTSSPGGMVDQSTQTSPDGTFEAQHAHFLTIQSSTARPTQGTSDNEPCLVALDLSNKGTAMHQAKEVLGGKQEINKGKDLTLSAPPELPRSKKVKMHTAHNESMKALEQAAKKMLDLSKDCSTQNVVFAVRAFKLTETFFLLRYPPFLEETEDHKEAAKNYQDFMESEALLLTMKYWATKYAFFEGCPLFAMSLLVFELTKAYYLIMNCSCQKEHNFSMVGTEFEMVRAYLHLMKSADSMLSAKVLQNPTYYSAALGIAVVIAGERVGLKALHHATKCVPPFVKDFLARKDQGITHPPRTVALYQNQEASSEFVRFMSFAIQVIYRELEKKAVQTKSDLASPPIKIEDGLMEYIGHCAATECYKLATSRSATDVRAYLYTESKFLVLMALEIAKTLREIIPSSTDSFEYCRNKAMQAVGIAEESIIPEKLVQKVGTEPSAAQPKSPRLPIMPSSNELNATNTLQHEQPSCASDDSQSGTDGLGTKILQDENPAHKAAQKRKLPAFFLQSTQACPATNNTPSAQLFTQPFCQKITTTTNQSVLPSVSGSIISNARPHSAPLPSTMPEVASHLASNPEPQESLEQERLAKEPRLGCITQEPVDLDISNPEPDMQAMTSQMSLRQAHKVNDYKCYGVKSACSSTTV